MRFRSSNLNGGYARSRRLPHETNRATMLWSHAFSDCFSLKCSSRSTRYFSGRQKTHKRNWERNTTNSYRMDDAQNTNKIITEDPESIEQERMPWTTHCTMHVSLYEKRERASLSTFRFSLFFVSGKSIRLALGDNIELMSETRCDVPSATPAICKQRPKYTEKKKQFFFVMTITVDLLVILALLFSVELFMHPGHLIPMFWQEWCLRHAHKPSSSGYWKFAVLSKNYALTGKGRRLYSFHVWHCKHQHLNSFSSSAIIEHILLLRINLQLFYSIRYQFRSIEFDDDATYNNCCRSGCCSKCPFNGLSAFICSSQSRVWRVVYHITRAAGKQYFILNDGIRNMSFRMFTILGIQHAGKDNTYIQKHHTTATNNNEKEKNNILSSYQAIVLRRSPATTLRKWICLIFSFYFDKFCMWREQQKKRNSPLRSIMVLLHCINILNLH